MTTSTQRLPLRFALLIFGVICGATAVIMIKASTEHPLLLASYRLLLAALALTPFFVRDLSNRPGVFGWTQLKWCALPAMGLAIHFMSWIIGARMTQVANASLIANLTPVAMPFFVWILYRERITRQELIGTLFTLAGLIVLSGSNLNISKTSFTGDVICFGSMLAFAAYLALGRGNSQRMTIWMYMVPLYWMAGLICLICALFFVNPIKTYEPVNLLYILGLAIIPTIGGHTILNYSLKYFRSQIVSVTNLAQPLFATLMGVLFFGETPRLIFYPAAALIIVGILIVLLARHPQLPIS
jgi:drug/metabolite transporter (DMT)-like permease